MTAQSTSRQISRTGAVIVNWNTADFLIDAVRSFLLDGVRASDIIVVDQGSSDRSVSMVKRQFHGVTVLSLPENRSYAAAINKGVSLLNTDFVVVANADVRFEKGIVQHLREVIDRDERVAVVGPRLTDGSGRDVTRFSRTGVVRAILLLLTPSVMHGLWKRTEQGLNNATRPFPVSWVEGSFMLIRRAAFDEVGGFDESFSFFFEDGDFAVRLKELGFGLVHCPDVAVTHLGGRSFSQVPDRATLEFYRNCLHFYERHFYRRSLWLRSLLRAVLQVKIAILRLRLQRRTANLEPFRSMHQILSISKIETTKSVLSDTPLVSIIIPTYERIDCLVRLLGALKQQTYKNFEIIVVDQSEVIDRQKQAAFKSFGRRLRLVRTDRKNRCHAKNLGIRHAKGEIFLFLDDDIVPALDLVEVHRKSYDDPTVGAVSCRVIEPSSPLATPARIQRIAGYGQMVVGFQANRTCYVGTLAGRNMSIPRQIQERVGLFDVALVGTSIFEEPDFSARIRRLGYHILFTNRSCVQHFPQTNGNDDWKSKDPAQYYHWFHHNEILYFLKNHRRLALCLVIPFCFLRTVKQSRKFHLNIRGAQFVFSGIFEGFSTYNRIYQ